MSAPRNLQKYSRENILTLICHIFQEHIFQFPINNILVEIKCHTYYSKTQHTTTQYNIIMEKWYLDIIFTF